MLRVKEIPRNDRPYERLIEYGKEILSNEELLAILIKSGTKNLSSKMLAGRIISEIKSLDELRNIKYENLIKIKGIGPAKACNILAAIEFGRRINESKYEDKRLVISNALDVYNFYKDKLENKEQEYFYCLYLDSKKKVKKNKLVFMGTINYSVVHPREIFKEAYLVGSTSIIAVHNHPTGDVTPSKQDIDTTNKLIEVGNLLGIKLDDHVIIGKNKYFSFFENAKLG